MTEAEVKAQSEALAKTVNDGVQPIKDELALIKGKVEAMRDALLRLIMALEPILIPAIF